MKKRHICLTATICGAFFLLTAYAKENEGFLTADTSPDSLVILPPPPAGDTIAFQRDRADY